MPGLDLPINKAEMEIGGRGLSEQWVIHQSHTENADPALGQESISI